MGSAPEEDVAKDSLDVLNEVDATESPVMDGQSKGSSSEDRKSEDLFLNIAKDSEKQQTPHHDTRKSRASLPFFANTGLALGSREGRPRSQRQAWIVLNIQPLQTEPLPT